MQSVHLISTVSRFTSLILPRKLLVSQKKKIVKTFILLYVLQRRTEGGVWWVQPPPPKFRSFNKFEPDCKLSGKCLVFLFQHPISLKIAEFRTPTPQDIRGKKGAVKF